MEEDKISNETPNDIYVLLLREKFGADEAIGEPKNLGNKETIKFTDKKLGTTSKKSDKYYLQFYKIYKDDFIATGSGKVKTK